MMMLLLLMMIIIIVIIINFCIDLFSNGNLYMKSPVLMALRPNTAHGLLFPEVSRSHTTHHSR